MTDVYSRGGMRSGTGIQTLDPDRSTTLRGWLRAAREMLAKAGVENAEQEAAWLLQAGLGVTRLALHRDGSKILGLEDRERILGLLERRARLEPLQYILGTQEFCGMEFWVTSSVLIPRPETELLVREVINVVQGQSAPVLADIGTGSGCVAIALARELPESLICATDVSAAALSVAHDNAERLGVSDRVRFLEGDLLAPLYQFELKGRVSVLVSNPPYIPEDEIGRLQPEVSRYEPRVALAGGTDGLAFHRRLLSEASIFLAPGGVLLLEIGEGQADAVVNLAMNLGFYQSPKVLKDEAGILRVVRVELRASD